MKTLRIAILAALLLPACDFDVSDLNRPPLDSIQTHPTPSIVRAVATGLLIGARKGATERVGYVVEWGILGREALVITPSDPRFIGELLQGSLDPGSNNFGGNFWVIPYANIRGANLLLHAITDPVLKQQIQPPVPAGMTDAELEAIRGFAETIQALDYLQVVDAHDVSGAVLNVDTPIGTPSTIVTSTDQIYTFIEGLLDDAQTHLIAGGPAFPFPLGSGFSAPPGSTLPGFDTPLAFLTFNRALRARVAVYHGKYNDALTALAGSFLDRAQPLTLGAYHAYGKLPGDLPNDLNTPDILVHSSVITEAEAGDDRIFGPNTKVKKLTKPVAGSGHSSQYLFTKYPVSESPIPIIRNEELILLRAEANIGLGNIGAGGGGARGDINFIRGAHGLNPVLPFGSPAAALDELLKQKRYSLLFEGGHRWIDLRRYGKLDAAHVAVDIPCPQPAGAACDVINSAYPIPTTEGH
jgi:hypothetical protein